MRQTQYNGRNISQRVFINLKSGAAILLALQRQKNACIEHAFLSLGKLYLAASLLIISLSLKPNLVCPQNFNYKEVNQ